MVNYRTGSSFCVNSRFKTYSILAKIAQLEPPCTIGICYTNDIDKARIERYINDIIPLGVEYKFIKTGSKTRGGNGFFTNHV